MSMDMAELEHMVQTILKKYAEDNECPPWPKDIIAQVFYAIEESTFVYRRHYDRLIGPNGVDRDTINQNIGKLVKDITGLEVLREGCKPRPNQLLTAYSELG